MRLRNIPEAAAALAADTQYTIHTTHPDELFVQYQNPDQPMYIEIGMGKGGFIWNHALLNPQINYLGIEKYDSVQYLALKKYLTAEQPLNNLKIITFDAKNLVELLPSASIDRIYLNFSDPWPKKRHAKRRLTSPQFLKQYYTILKANGEVHLKTDNDELFAYTCEVLAESPDWIIKEQTTDLYTSSMLAGNIPTEYETKFHKAGKNINKIIFQKKENKD